MFEHRWTVYGVLTVIVGVLFFFRQYLANTALHKVPGPKLYAITRFRLAFDAWQASSVNTIHKLHLRYGPAVRVGPNEISFNSLTALKTIYGAGSSFERTRFYRMFDVYGTPNLFTFATGKDHRERKKLLSHIYANQTILGSEHTKLVQEKVLGYMRMLEKEPAAASEIFSSLHYFSFDTISEFVYGPDHGGDEITIVRERSPKPSGRHTKSSSKTYGMVWCSFPRLHQVDLKQSWPYGRSLSILWV